MNGLENCRKEFNEEQVTYIPQNSQNFARTHEEVQPRIVLNPAIPKLLCGNLQQYDFLDAVDF